MSKERFFIDANVPMYAAGAPHPLKKPCIRILERIAAGRLYAVTDVEVLLEILHRYTSLGRREDAIRVAELFMTVIPEIIPIGSEDFIRALRIQRQFPHLQARDSLHIAVMLNHRIRYIVSADRHFDGVPGIKRIDPAGWA